jgi:serine/threonine protein phosphatase PrpC
MRLANDQSPDPGEKSPEQQHLPRDWRVVGASVCGTAHQKNQQMCQDAHHWQILPEGILVAAIADGAGSASLGKVGAIVATEVAVKSICLSDVTLSLLESDEQVRRLLTTALLTAKEAVQEEAVASSKQPRDLASTLIILIATPYLVAAAQIGDGAAIAKDTEGNLIALTQPQSGEYINETTFLISPDALDTAQVTVWRQPVANVAALTDGLQMLALDMTVGVPFKPFFAPLFEFAARQTDRSAAVEQLVTFLRSERVAQRTDDDLTLLLAAIAN